MQVTDDPVVALKKVAGDQTYVFAPLAVSTTLPPVQTAGLTGAMVIVGNGFTVTII